MKLYVVVREPVSRTFKARKSTSDIIPYIYASRIPVIPVVSREQDKKKLYTHAYTTLCGNVLTIGEK